MHFEYSLNRMHHGLPDCECGMGDAYYFSHSFYMNTNVRWNQPLVSTIHGRIVHVCSIEFLKRQHAERAPIEIKQTDNIHWMHLTQCKIFLAILLCIWTLELNNLSWNHSIWLYLLIDDDRVFLHSPFSQADTHIRYCSLMNQHSLDHHHIFKYTRTQKKWTHSVQMLK